MEFSGFFDYPVDAPGSDQPSLVFLPELGESDWEIIFSSCQRRAFAAGEEVLRVGDTGRALYIVARGKLEVMVPQKRERSLRIATLGEGSVFGEQAFLDGQARSATVRAVSDGEIQILSLESFDLLSARHPDLARAMLMDLGRILSLRLRAVMSMAADNIR